MYLDILLHRDRSKDPCKKVIYIIYMLRQLFISMFGTFPNVFFFLCKRRMLARDISRKSDIMKPIVGPAKNEHGVRKSFTKIMYHLP